MKIYIVIICLKLYKEILTNSKMKLLLMQMTMFLSNRTQITKIILLLKAVNFSFSSLLTRNNNCKNQHQSLNSQRSRVIMKSLIKMKI